MAKTNAVAERMAEHEVNEYAAAARLILEGARNIADYNADSRKIIRRWLALPRCADCGAFSEPRGHQECLYPR